MFTTKILEERTFNTSTQTTYQINRRARNKQIDVPEVEKLCEKLLLTGKKFNAKIMIRALVADKWVTLKGFSTDLKIVDFEEYYLGKVKDATKFDMFDQLQVSILRDNEPVKVIKNKIIKK